MAKFEENLAALEAVVDKLERGDLSLEDSVKLFEDGVGLSNACKAELDAAEGKVQVLIEQSNGKAVVTDLEVEDSEEDDE
jgi:exodeoxyribonuclease VII small subunit